jgi:hypothetical protein
MKFLARIACALCLVTPAVATADDITIGLYAPTAPFESSGDRVSFINAVSDHLGPAANGAKVTAKVYASASAYAAAVKKGEIQFAIVDAPYAAANGMPYTVLASATRSGDTSAQWQLIAKSSIGAIRDLKGAKVAIPTVGAKANAFVTNVLLGGEVDASYFGSITEAPDVRSAVTLITVGKADAAFVPAGTDAPSGTKRLISLPSVGWPVFVALPGSDAKLGAAFASRLKGFGGAGGFGGFADASNGTYRGLVGAFNKSTKHGPMALPPPARLSVREILAGRTTNPALSDVLDVVEAPPTKSAPAK